MTAPDPSPAEFDEHAADYEAALMRGLELSGETKAYFVEGRIAAVRNWLRRAARPAPGRIVDYGCGLGDATLALASAFPEARVLGIDPSTRLIARAQETTHPDRVSFAVLDERQDGDALAADLVYLNGVAHHVPPPDRPRFFNRLAACVAARNGVVAFFENNPLNPGTHLVMSRIPFDADAVKISPRQARRHLVAAGLRPEFTGYYFYFPGFLRFLRPLEAALVRLPFGAQYGIFSRGARAES